LDGTAESVARTQMGWNDWPAGIACRLPPTFSSFKADEATINT
jgi:hypothetical protein